MTVRIWNKRTPEEPLNASPADVVEDIDLNLIGQVLKVLEDRSIEINFSDTDFRTYSSLNAKLSLKLVTQQGLKHGYHLNPLNLESLAEANPRKLVALALKDCKGLTSRAKLITSTLEQLKLIPSPSTKWWGAVSKMLKESTDYFKFGNGNSITLINADLDNLSDEPLVSVAVRPRKATKARLPDEEVSDGIRSGQVKFYDLESAQLKKTLKTFGLQSDWGWVASLDEKECIGHPKATRVLLEQLAKIGFSQIWVSLLLNVQQEMLDHLKSQVEAMKIPSQRKWISDACLLQKQAIDNAPKELLQTRSDDLVNIIKGVLTMLIQLIAMSQDVTATGIHHLGASFRLKDYAVCLGQSLRMLVNDKPTEDLVQTLDAILQEMDEDHIVSTLKVLWNECPEVSIESGWHQLSNKKSPHQILSILREQLMSTKPTESTLHATANYLTRLSKLYPSAEKDEVLITQLAVGLQYYKDDISFSKELVNNIVTNLGSKIEQTWTKGASPLALEGLHAAHSQLSQQIEHKHKEATDAKNVELDTVGNHLQAEMASHTETRGKLEDLRSGSSTPDAIARIQGQVEVLQAFATYHQELAMGNSNANSTLNTKATIMQIERILSQFTVNIIGSPGDTQGFNPSEHTPISPIEGAGAPVEIIAPGFRWTNSNGEQGILIRSFVKPINPGNLK
jgi:hypothetical protein